MKIPGYDLHKLPQDPIDAIQDIITVINFGKYQVPVFSSPPTHVGRRGEEVVVFGATTAAFYMCTTDNTATWRATGSFTL